MKWGYLGLLVAWALGCDNGTVRSVASAAASAVTPTQTVTRTCPACQGHRTHAVEHEVRQDVEVVDCNLENTGFLGIGNGRRASVRVRNAGDLAGDTTITVTALYPGDGSEVVKEQQVRTRAHHDGRISVDFNARDGMTNIRCGATPISATRTTQEPCEVCHGTGTITTVENR